MIRNTLKDLCLMYVGAGLFAGLLFKAAIPALNPYGFTYIVASWPALIYCAPKSRGCDGLPPSWLGPYLFSFDENKASTR